MPRLGSVGEMAEATVVKLGGSIVTRKRGPPRLRKKLLARLAREVAAVREPPLIVLHGAGSFGHPGAVRWNLSAAPAATSSRDRGRGAAVVSAEVRRLHLAVLHEIVRAGRSGFSVPAQSVAQNAAGRLHDLSVAPFREVLAGGGTPVSFGDVVRDSEWGYSILSADTIAVELVRAGLARRVIFVSDVPGVISSSVGRPAIVPLLDASVVERLKPEGAGPDVTGGIRGKVEAMLEIASLGGNAGLISGLSDGAVERALRGEDVYGSWARASSR